MLYVIYAIYDLYILRQKVSYTSFILIPKHNVLIELGYRKRFNF